MIEVMPGDAYEEAETEAAISKAESDGKLVRMNPTPKETPR